MNLMEKLRTGIIYSIRSKDKNYALDKNGLWCHVNAHSYKLFSFNDAVKTIKSRIYGNHYIFNEATEELISDFEVKII